MNAVVYLFQVSACMGIFYLFYYLLLSRYTFFTINRWYLIITLAISFIIPLLTITMQQQETYPQVIKQVVYINQMQTPQQVVIIDQAPAQVQINWMALVKIVYMVAVAALFLRLMLMVVKFFARIRNKKRTKIGGVLIVKGDEQLSNGSFFNYIFLNDDELSADELEQIIAHEMLHVKLYHSVDRILIKIAQVFLWFNPFVYLYARAIEENHEFEVDRAVSSSTDRNKYAELLFHLSVARQGALYHNFSMVPLKKRITMLFTKPTNRMKKVIYLLVVPVVLISCLAFAKLKNEGSIKIKKSPASVVADTTVKVKYRQKSKLTPAQRNAQDEGFKKMQAYFESPEGKQKMALSKSIQSKEITVDILGDYNNKDGMFRGKMVREKGSGNEFLLLSWYGQGKQLNNQLNKGDEVSLKVFSGGVAQDRPVTITPAYVIKNGKKIFQLAEAEKIPDYPFLYEANKVRFAEGQISNIAKYPNGKWKTAVFERVNGYKFNLTFKPNGPDLNSIKWGDHVRLRFVHEVKTGDKTYKINDWVAISTDIRDYGIKNPEWFYKFYEVVKTDTGKVSVIKGIEGLGKNPLVLIDGKQYDKEILYKISNRGFSGWSTIKPNDGSTQYGEKARDGAVLIKTRDGKISYLTDTEKENLVKISAAKRKFFSRVTLTKEDGSKYDMAFINRATGGTAAAELPVNGKVAIIINGKLYNENDFKRLFPADNVNYGASIGVSSGATKDLEDRGFKVDGYNAIFKFDSGNLLKSTSTSEKTGASTLFTNGPVYRSWSSGKSVVRSPALITGGASDFRGNRMTMGFTIGPRGYKKSPAVSVFSPYFHSNNTGTSKDGADTKKSDEDMAPNAKDTVGSNLGGKTPKQTIAMLPGMEVRSDGSLWVNNQPVKRALINGKEYGGGGASQVVNALPVEIINKVKATINPAANGSSKPERVLNISTKPDKTQNTDLKNDLLNSVPAKKTEYNKLNDSLVAAPFAGTVTTVQDIMGTEMVIIKKGEYFAALSNLKTVKVLKGQEVKRGQLLGLAAFNPDENKVAARLELYRGQLPITDKTEQEVIIRDLGLQRLDMRLKLGEVYAFKL